MTRCIYYVSLYIKLSTHHTSTKKNIPKLPKCLMEDKRFMPNFQRFPLPKAFKAALKTITLDSKLCLISETNWESSSQNRNPQKNIHIYIYIHPLETKMAGWKITQSLIGDTSSLMVGVQLSC